MRLSNARSRWGSCHASGRISLNWRLIHMPRHLIDYVVVHELAHLREMNHSPRFWKLLERLCPNTERAKVWLDVHGPDLHRYGLPADEKKAPRPRGSLFS